jgi:hypothetical protein
VADDSRVEVAVAVGSGVLVAVGSGVDVAVGSGVLVADGSGVKVAVGSGVLVAVGSGVKVAVGVFVATGSSSTVTIVTQFEVGPTWNAPWNAIYERVPGISVSTGIE